MPVDQYMVDEIPETDGGAGTTDPDPIDHGPMDVRIVDDVTMAPGVTTITTPSGDLRLIAEVTYGDLLVALMLFVGVVYAIGSRTYDRVARLF